MTKIAIIDMGTNTFHLLLAEVYDDGSQIVHRDYEAVRIGVAGINQGYITESACDRTLRTMAKFREVIDRFKIQTVYAIATSAFRNARNGRSLAVEVERTTGIAVDIISGEVEADYIFAGVRAAMDLGDRKSLVMDIGAGSVEFIIGDKQNICWKESFEIGGQRLLEKFEIHDPILPREINALNDYFEEKLTSLHSALRTFCPAVLVGSSGTFDTLSAVYCGRHGIQSGARTPEIPLTLAGFFEIYEDLIKKNRDERMAVPGMIALRVDLIVVGCCLVRFLLERHNFEDVRVSTYALKEGVLAKFTDTVRTHQ